MLGERPPASTPDGRITVSPKSPNPETEAMERAARAKQLPHKQGRDPQPRSRPDTGSTIPAGAQGARPRDGL